MQEVQMQQQSQTLQTRCRSYAQRVVAEDQSPWVKYRLEISERQVSLERSD